MAENGHSTLIYMEQGGAKQTVASGGVIDVAAAGGLKVAGVSVDPANTTVANVLASTATGKKVIADSHTVTSLEAIATTLTIATGITTVATAIAQVVTAGYVVATSDAVVSVSSGNLTVANGSTFTLVAGQIINWFAFGV